MPDFSDRRVTGHLKVVLASEPWCEYTLEDGTVVRARLLLSGIRRVVDQFNSQGDPVFAWTQGPQIEVVCEESQRGAPTRGPGAKTPAPNGGGPYLR